MSLVLLAVLPASLSRPGMPMVDDSSPSCCGGCTPHDYSLFEFEFPVVALDTTTSSHHLGPCASAFPVLTIAAPFLETRLPIPLTLNPMVFLDRAEALQLTCGICFNVCVRPLTLKCPHLYCETCLQTTAPRRCPDRTCRRRIRLPCIVNQLAVRRIELAEITCPFMNVACTTVLTPGRDQLHIQAHICPALITPASPQLVAGTIAGFVSVEMPSLRSKMLLVERSQEYHEKMLRERCTLETTMRSLQMRLNLQSIKSAAFLPHRTPTPNAILLPSLTVNMQTTA